MTTFAAPEAAEATGPRHMRVPFVLTLLFLAMTLVPPARGNPNLEWSIAGVAGGLLLWQAVLWAIGRRTGRSFGLAFVPVKAHWVQASVQGVIFCYWAWYVDMVIAEVPLILSQVVFFYVLDALLSWSRGRTWRLGFGPLPIVISTNLLLWFEHDVYFLQYMMLLCGALAKNFVTWERDGRRTHIFNPSAFGQSFVAIFLIATGTTTALTKGTEIAITFEVPHMLIVIFLMGLIVQHLFQVTLMTFTAVLALVGLNMLYTQFTGLYFFVNANIAAPIFLGVHLLLTDPSTSPRSYIGRALFGALYGCGYFVLYRILDNYDVPLFWDKLLPVPILNLCVPLIDRFVRLSVLGRLNARWEGVGSKGMNLLHMLGWTAVMAALLTTGFIESKDHPGNSVKMWKEAYINDRPHAGPSLVKLLRAHSEDGGSGDAYNELGLMHMNGDVLEQDPAMAAYYFQQACDLRSAHGCVNFAIQYLFRGETLADADETLMMAFDLLEAECEVGEVEHEHSCFLAAHAYETGRGRPQDNRRAFELYARAAQRGDPYSLKGVARVALQTQDPRFSVRGVAGALAPLAEAGDAEAMYYLAYMHITGIGVTRDVPHGIVILQRACAAGLDDACEALQADELPPFRRPLMVVPGWSTAWPLDDA